MKHLKNFIELNEEDNVSKETEIFDYLLTNVEPGDYETEEEYCNMCVEISSSQFGIIPETIKDFCKENWDNKPI